MNTKVPSPKSDAVSQFAQLVEIVAKLRGPGGCPWDRSQTQKSLTQYAIEEAFELAEAIESGQTQAVVEELGDFLFQVVLQAQVAADEGRFELKDVIAVLNEKMLRRHPHVFAGVEVSGLEEVWKNWEQTKRAEKANKAQNSVFGLPAHLPALQAAHKIGVKTERYKFDWESPQQVMAKVHEETNELSEAMQSGDKQALEHEVGDLLFSVAQLARHLGLEPEQCLRIANQRFEKRFTSVLELSKVPRDQFAALTTAEKEELWVKAKEVTG